MKKQLDRRNRFGRQAFTMIELMVVVSIVAILIGSVFKIFKTVQDMNAKATTIARMQRLQNAISAFYSEYGYYPPVARYTSPDPWNLPQDDNGNIPNTSSEEGFADVCRRVSACQPIDFEFPPAKKFDASINRMYQQYGIQSANTCLGPTADTIKEVDWKDVKMFKFGLLSFLLPRLETIGFSGSANPNTDEEPDLHFFSSRQWKKNNPVSSVSNVRKALEAQKVTENRAAARWLPNLENIVKNGQTILGVNLGPPYDDPEGNKLRLRILTDKDGNPTGYSHGGKYFLQYAGLEDGWGHTFYYYSPPPYQSYQLWSSGRDYKTFPPWIPIKALSDTERKWVTRWVEDDIVRTDH